MDNPFKPYTKEELKKIEEEKKATEVKIKKATDDAHACLNSSVFEKYRASAKEAREGLIKLMKLNDDPDPIKFAFFVKACLSKIDVLDMIIEGPQKDAKKR